MFMKIAVESLNKKHQRLIPKIRKTALKLGRLLGLTSAFVDIFLVGDAFMRKNVLAFPAPKRFPRPDREGRYLGEIYLNPDYVKRHKENLIFMLVHGLLHLLGYDHIGKNDRIKMERKEHFLLKKLAIGKQ